jgi:hypothetical protein
MRPTLSWQICSGGAEVSLQVDGDDINRVTQRTNTLHRSGVQAVAIVIGEDWARLDTQEQARA